MALPRIITYESNIRSRRISVTTGDNGWKVGGAGGKRSSTQQQPRAAVVHGADFHERRMRRQSTGATIFEPPITPAYTPKTPGNNCRDSYNGYFSQTHATMSPQELTAPTMHPQPITKRESFVGGFVLPPAYPPYGSQQPIQQQQPQTPHNSQQYPTSHATHGPQQYPQTPHTPHHSQQYPAQTSHATHAQQQYPQTPHTPHHSQQYPAQTSHATHPQQQYPQTPHTPHNSQQYPSQTPHSIHVQQQHIQTSHTTQHSQHRVSQQHSYHQNIHHQQYQQQPAISTAAQHHTDDGNSYYRNNNSHQQQQQQQRSTSASSYYRNNDYYNNPTNDEITFSNTTGAESSAISEDPPTERARSVKSVRSVKSSKSIKSASGTLTAGESRHLPAKKRQIIVQSINVGHRVHIDVAANETGQSLAEKIHQIATFRTRKIISITTATGRKISLDRRPVFDGWADIQNFENEEEWDVEWTSLDKSMIDRFFSKVVQVGEGGSTRNEEVRSTNNNNANNEMQQ
ncbi:hypothetical protein BDC45DRAFT_529933 [Circinella umbellata]|nr:hypothetical protein BDC45DRAFT_529933 [Circinella umbellata]